MRIFMDTKISVSLCARSKMLLIFVGLQIKPEPIPDFATIGYGQPKFQFNSL